MYEKVFVRANYYLENIGLSTYTIFIGIALVILIRYFIKSLETNTNYTRTEVNKLLIFLAISLGITYLFAYIFDGLFHYFESGVFSGGITFIAGFIGGIITFVLLVFFFEKDKKNDILNILNLIIPGVILAHAIGRLGCFSVGCCYGRPTDSIFGFYFPEGSIPYELGIRERIHPTQLYEALFLFSLFIVLKFNKFKGYNFTIYLISYGIFRFILELFFRGDSRGVIFGVAPSILLSLLLMVGGVVIAALQIVRKRRIELWVITI